MPTFNSVSSNKIFSVSIQRVRQMVLFVNISRKLSFLLQLLQVSNQETEERAMRVSDLCLCEGGPVQVYGQTALPCPSLSCCSYRAGLTGKATRRRSGRERGTGESTEASARESRNRLTSCRSTLLNAQDLVKNNLDIYIIRMKLYLCVNGDCIPWPADWLSIS